MAALLVMLSSRVSAQEPPAKAHRRSDASLQQLIDKFRVLLAIEKAVSISVVPVNPKVASMVPPMAAGQPFQLIIEGGFLDLLSDEELAAVIAHELGHVWVSTHHPYLQTEELANSIAMRVVARASLERVYAKVWARDGSTVDMIKFLGPPAPDTEGLAPNR